MATRDEEAITAKELSEFCGITPRRVGQLCDEGVLVRDKKGKFDAKKNVLLYIDSIKAAKTTTDDVKRLEKYKADLAEIELSRKRQEYAPVSLMQQWADNMVSVIRQGIYTLPNILPGVLIGLSTQPEIKAELIASIDRVCKDLSSPDLYDLAEKDMEAEYDRKSKHNPH